MARLGISFKDNFEEDIYLYNLILKNACGNTSHYIKSVLRQVYKDQGVYKYDYNLTSETQSDDEEFIIII